MNVNDELLNRARELLAAYDQFASTTPAEGVILNTIRDLMAEVERLQYMAHHRLEMFNQRKTLLREVQSAAQKAEARAEAAESQLRELASAEPVAWEVVSNANGYSELRRTYPTRGDGVFREDVELYALIRRPEMPS